MQIGIGAWKMRNGNKAIVAAHRPGTPYPWIGWDDGDTICSRTWSNDGKFLANCDCSLFDIISPWTSPIATGHNPDKLTEEQVGVKDGWRLLDEDEIHCNHQIRCMSSWVDDGAKWIEDTWGASRACTYRTRLSRSELAELDKPKMRLIRMDELPPVCWIDMGNGKRRLANGYDLTEQKFVAGGNHVSILVAKDKEWQWSSDLKNWNSFEVEDK